MCGSRAGGGEHVPTGGASVVPGGREILPKNVKPVHYDLTLEPDFEKFTYEGTVLIDLDVLETTSFIKLNATDLTVHSSEIIVDGKTHVSNPDVTMQEDDQTMLIAFSQPLVAGTKAQLRQKFTGILNEHMAGFYKCTYKGSDGKTKYMASTQMEPTDARRAFPCFDEPALKAEFTVTLIADKHMTCLSNMDVASEKDVQSDVSKGIRKAVTFNRSPLMSTYLVAFIVGELKYIESNEFRVPTRVYVTEDQDVEHGRFSLDVCAKTLKFYEEAFDSKFPLPKMDMVAVPDFSAGAMENWGLITYRIVDVLYDEKTTGASMKQRIAETVQHELAHQWFGNLVTMDFWDGLWLNEGFATWMSWYAMNHFWPEWKVWETYVVDNLQMALALDALRSSHPIEVPIKRADEINQIFDAISYSKGSSVLRMMSKYIGEETFIEGVRAYIAKHAYGNTQTGDLWAALTQASGKPVDKVMGTWTTKVGVPVVTVSEKPEKKVVSLKQNRFLATGDATPEEDATLYPVILGLRSKEGVNEDLILSEREQEFPVDLDFFKVNAEHSGIYRTSYSPERLAKLGQAAKAGLLPVEDRAGMIADAGALAVPGYQKTSGVLTLFKSFDTESEYVVWQEIISRLASLRSAWIFEDDKSQAALKSFQRSLVSQKAHEIGWEFSDKDGHNLQLFKALMFRAAGVAGDEKVVAAAKELFERVANGDVDAVHPNLRAPVFDIVLRNGGEREFEIVLSRFRAAATSAEKNTILRTLGSTSRPDLVKRVLDLSLSEEVRSQDVYLPLSGLRSHATGIKLRWEWYKENFAEIAKRHPPTLSMFGSIVQVCTGGFTTEEQISEIENFFKDKDTKGYDQTLAQSIDSVRAKARWVSRDRTDVEQWLKENKYL
ncbi:Aminopeptidase 2 mitochondrial [Ascosphaera pollenicola]|nr:Aminopeptidase 2 mitochondrial [Ascosphaera pollenicola]